MEVNGRKVICNESSAIVVEELSNGNSFCKLCFSYLTLGKQDFKTENLGIHLNGRKHKFCSLMLEKSFHRPREEGLMPETDWNFNEGSCTIFYLYENGIYTDINIGYNFYCYFCDCELPKLSSDKRFNIFNVKVHLNSKRHNFSVLCNLGSQFDVKSGCSNETESSLRLNNVESVDKMPQFYSSIVAAFHSNESFSVENIFDFIPDQWQDHKKFIQFIDNFRKFKCILCKCFISLSHNKITMVSNVVCHVQGRKHLRLFSNKSNNSENICFNSVTGDVNLEEVINVANNKLILKNRKYIFLNSSNNVGCRLCNSFLPNNGRGGHSLVIKNLKTHFSGKKHCRLKKEEVKQEINTSDKNGSNDVDGNYDETVCKIYDKVNDKLPKHYLKYLTISKSSNLICILCSCVLDVNIQLSSCEKIAISIDTHIRSQKHKRNRFSVDNSNNNSIEKYVNICSKYENILAYDLVETVIKLDSYGQFVCSMCLVILSTKCDLETAILSHLKGKRHKTNINSHFNKFTENILINIIDSLPFEFKINKKCMSFVHNKYGCVICNVCNYMFTAKSNYKLKNNLMIHVTSDKHKKLLKHCKQYQHNDESNYDEKTDKNFSFGLDANDFPGILLKMGCDKFLEYIFLNYIPESLMNNRKYISLKSNDLYCNACCSALTTPTKLSAAVLILLNHFSDDTHKNNLSTSSSNFDYNTFGKISIKKIFKNHIPEDLQFNKLFITDKGDHFLCHVCDCQVSYGKKFVTTLGNMVTHLRGSYHNKKIQLQGNVNENVGNIRCNETFSNNNEQSLFDLFTKHIHQDMQFNRQYIVLKSTMLVCTICEVKMIQSNNFQKTARNLLDHLEGTLHKNKLKALDISDENSKNMGKTAHPIVDTEIARDRISLDLIFKNFINDDFHVYRKDIILNSANFACIICNQKIVFSSNPRTTAQNIVDHLKCSHVTTLNKNDQDVSAENDSVHNNLLNHNYAYTISNLFSEFIPDEFHLHLKFITIEESHINCQLCNYQLPYVSPQAAAKNVLNHLKSLSHKETFYKLTDESTESVQLSTSNRKINNTNETADINGVFLDKVFKYVQNSAYQFNKKYIFMNKKVLVCEICKCSLPTSICPELTASSLNQHLSGSIHIKNLLSKNTILKASEGSSCRESVDNSMNKNSQSFLEDVFKHFIPRDFQYQKKFLESVQSSYLCKVCGAHISKSVSLKDMATNVMDHLKGRSHNRLLNEKDCEMTRNPSNSNGSEFTCKTGAFLDEVFKNFVSSAYQFNRMYIQVDKNVLVCEICKCTLPTSMNPKLSAESLVQHLSGGVHKNNLLKVSEPSTFSQNISISLNENISFLEDVFKKFIPKDFQSHKIFLIVDGNGYLCKLCCIRLSKSVSLETMAKNMIDHFRGRSHNKYIKEKDSQVNSYPSSCKGDGNGLTRKSGTFLEEVFKNVLHGYQDNKMYISMDKSVLVCDICKCTLPTSASPKTTAENLVQHLRGGFHKNNLSKGNINEKTSEGSSCCASIGSNLNKDNQRLLEDVFKLFIPGDFQYHVKFLVVIQNEYLCKVCGVHLSKALSLEKTAKIMMDHLKGQSHQSKVKKREIEVESSLSSCNDDGNLSEVSKPYLGEVNLKGQSHTSYLKEKDYKIKSIPSSCISDRKSSEIGIWYLDNIFDNFISHDLQIFKSFISETKKKLVCLLCDYSFTKPVEVETSAQILVQHLRDESHNSKFLKKKGIKAVIASNVSYCKQGVSENLNKFYGHFLEDAFNNFIPGEFQSQKKYFIVDQNGYVCELCGCHLVSRFVSPKVTAENLLEHLKGNFHNNNLKRKQNEMKSNHNADPEVVGKLSRYLEECHINSYNS